MNIPINSYRENLSREIKGGIENYIRLIYCEVSHNSQQSQQFAMIFLFFFCHASHSMCFYKILLRFERGKGKDFFM